MTASPNLVEYLKNARGVKPADQVDRELDVR